MPKPVAKMLWIALTLILAYGDAGAQQESASGLDLSLIDPNVRPQDDFYQYANGAWLSSVEIPPDKNTVGVWQDVTEKIQSQLRAIAEEMSGKHAPRGSIEQIIGDFYASYMDERHIEELGDAPLADELKQIDHIQTPGDITRQFMHFIRIGVSTPITSSVVPDSNNAESHIFVLAQSGLGLPDRSYYLDDDESYREILDTSYPAYIGQLLDAAGVGDAAGKARAIITLERRLAEAQWSRADSRDPDKRYNPYDTNALDQEFPGFEWSTLLSEAGVAAESYIVIRQPDYFQTLARLVAETPVETWQAYLMFRLIDARARYLSKAFADAYFDFHRGTLQGRREPQPRWERGLDLLDEMAGDALSQIWVQRHFSPDIKKQLEGYVTIFIQAFHEGIDELEWMSDTTKAEAHTKLNKLRVYIGYPDEWPDYGALVVDRGDLVGNVARARAFAAGQALRLLEKRPDEVETWVFPPHTVVAYAVPSRNEIYFLAGSLLPPYFMPDADLATNFGSLSTLIGHEISHLFDDSGRRYNGDGELNDWWTPEDAPAFVHRAEILVEQYNQYEPIKGVHIDGRQTLGENIGDLSGVSVAYRAYKNALWGRKAPVIDGFTGDQRFFLARAQTFRSKMTDQRIRQWLATRPHSLPRFRVNGIHANMPEFYDAFDVKPGDGMYLRPEKRVKIW